MNELLKGIHAAHLVELFLDIVFHGLHVVVGHFLNILHALGTLLIEVAVNIAQSLKLTMVEVLQLGQRQLTKGNEIFYLNTDAIAYQGVL